MRKAWIVLVVAGVSLTACGGGNKAPHLMNLRSTTDGPDEFAILPPKSLSLPADMANLPKPTPGGGNLTDPHPEDDAILALGGKIPKAGGIPAGDAGLVRYADRNGGSPAIRQTLAADDLAYRKKHPGKFLERAFSLTTYFEAYRAMWLNQYVELAKWRAAGVPTPSAPPPETGKK